MSINKRGYIARKFYAHNYGSQTIYEEGIFESYELAYKFIQEISEEDHHRFLSEIVSYPMNDNQPWESDQLWTFDRKGTLIRHLDTQKTDENSHIVVHDGFRTIYHEPDPESYKCKFKIGDIVSIKAFPWNSDSTIPEDTIGVIINTPVLYDVWIKQGNNKYEWDSFYVIDYIREGYLDHMHIQEQHLKNFNNEVPENLTFLKTLSAHYQRKIEINEDIFKDINDGKIFVEKVRHFNENESYNLSNNRL